MLTGDFRGSRGRLKEGARVMSWMTPSKMTRAHLTRQPHLFAGQLQPGEKAIMRATTDSRAASVSIRRTNPASAICDIQCVSGISIGLEKQYDGMGYGALKDLVEVVWTV